VLLAFIYFKEDVVNIQLTVLALTKKELYLTAKHMKKHKEGETFITKSYGLKS
jgi:hypothetical protein